MQIQPLGSSWQSTFRIDVGEDLLDQLGALGVSDVPGLANASLTCLDVEHPFRHCAQVLRAVAHESEHYKHGRCDAI